MEGRGLTLRSKTRRPQISAPKPISGPVPTNNAQSSGNAPAFPPLNREKTQQSGATSDLVKRRYSTRFNQLPDFNANAPPMPGVPKVPDGYGSAPQDPGATPSASQPIRVDVNALRDPSLPAEKYVANLLANASEQDIRDYQNSLRKVKNRTSTDLQQNVYQNRTQFIKISKEAEKLKDEMRTLRGLMSDLTTALGQANATNDNSTTSTLDERQAKRNNRSSVANLENMWNVQLQTLWKTIERSQKFLPAVPGRHVILETGHWAELDSATWKPKRPIHIVLLNDHLLVAGKKRKKVDPNVQHKGPIPTKLVAEECWPLQDIDLIDLGANLGLTSPEAQDMGMTNAINVRYGSKSFTYRHDPRNTTAKNELLTTFRKAVEDLRKSMRTETENARKSKDFLSSPDSASRKSEMFDNINLSREQPEIRIDVDGKQQNIRWVEGQIDELDIDIALQRFENAVASVERLRKLAKGIKGKSIAQDIINHKVDERAGKLAGMISRSLIDKHSFLVATRTNVNWLSRLGFEDRAREAYLISRTEVIQKRARQCVFEGDLPLYIFQISFVYFTIIKNTIHIYQQCFPSLMMSACIKWAKEHLDGFNAILARQLSSVDPGTPAWDKCINIVHEHANLLSEVGVDFKDMVGAGLDLKGQKISSKQ
ncbi:exocyst complex component exo84 [Arachnomyces sp. PD_36]|nr:exocyst complex component exo84 [Arachnomyces sp. PD_36]